MSTISANDLQNTSGGIPTVKGQRLIPTAWVNFNGTGTVSIRDSENVSSISDNGVGSYAVSFTTSMASANYLASYTVGDNSGSVSTNITCVRPYSWTTAFCAIITAFGTNSLNDFDTVNVTFMGGQ